ncbi:MFS transporter [Mycobacterium sp. ITM-2016-00317]|uniref:MFS transporter n=1 Tax=Mycobacterium sp. ITM-2016-00317 TaxID=2099694 RepID=UPI00287F5AD8|nr:MFS transporter [Mycobacterium sp. ITM-2016-00317]WNG86774.1 MFS transporter [Mycobacterium sp. ITM-2016-00317]
MTDTPTLPAPVDDRSARHVVAGAGVGTFVEYFGDAVYAFMAVTLAAVFFPTDNPSVAILQTFAIFGVSFLMYPLGGMFWGHYGDKIGRKKVLAITILGMGSITSLIGLLPTYESIGWTAALLLLVARLLQGFCASGEYSGAAVFIGEFAPAAKRARYISVVPIGAASGFLVASLLITAMFSILGDAAMQDWGWRIPFLIAGPLCLIGWYIRSNLDESPAFLALQSDDRIAESPVAQVFRHHWRSVVRMLCIMAVNAGGYYLVLSYMVTYFQEEVALSATQSNLIATIALVLYLPLLFGAAALSDRIGRKPVLIANAALFILVSYPAFLLLGAAGFGAALAVQLLFVAMFSLNDGTFATAFVEGMPTEIRFSGFAIPFTLGIGLFAGGTPFLATWLISTTGSPVAPSFVLIAICVIALFGLVTMRETAPAKIAADEVAQR